MKKWILLFTVAIFGLATVPETGESCWRRRCRPTQCLPVRAQVAPAPSMVTIKGKTYRLLDTADQGEFAEKAQRPTVTASGISEDDTFGGTDRLTPKTTIVDVDIEEFESVAALVTQLLSSSPDAKMEEMGIQRDTDARVAAENRNVRVTGFIHAFKKEGDNDYHVILGDGSNDASSVYLNVEVSGIPVGGTNANRKRIMAVRDQFKATFNLGATGPSSYKRPHEPIPVRISGSLFWDVDHKPGAVGPSDMKPKTSWEIHPVSAIEFLDQ